MGKLSSHFAPDLLWWQSGICQSLSNMHAIFCGWSASLQPSVLTSLWLYAVTNITFKVLQFPPTLNNMPVRDILHALNQETGFRSVACPQHRRMAQFLMIRIN